jgi:putative heme iron utilization protein
MQNEMDQDSYAVRLNRCPYCTLNFLDEDKIIFRSHIQRHIESSRVMRLKCNRAERCRDYQAQDADTLAEHMITNHIQKRQCKSTSNRSKRAAQTADLIKNQLIYHLAAVNADPEEHENRPFGNPNGQNRGNNQRIDNAQPRQRIDNAQHIHAPRRYPRR